MFTFDISHEDSNVSFGGEKQNGPNSFPYPSIVIVSIVGDILKVRESRDIIRIKICYMPVKNL